MRLRSAVLACVLLHAEHVLCAPPLVKATQNSTSDTFVAVICSVVGFFSLLATCAWLNGNITCKEIGQCLT
jgi:hypothetical protein